MDTAAASSAKILISQLHGIDVHFNEFANKP